MSVQQSSPVSPPRSRRAFLAASVSLVCAFVASASPIPLFNTYRSQDGLTTADLSVAVVAYFAGTIVALMSLGRLSTHLGRRPVSIATVLVLMAGCAVLLDVHSIVPLAAGRFLMGVGSGMASSTLMAYVVDSAPADPPWLASVVTSQAPNLGLAVGVATSGVLVDYGPVPRVAVYVVMLAALAACAIALWLAPETHGGQPGWARSLRPRVGLPARARSLLPVAACGFAATWAMGAAYQAFGPTITADFLHTNSALAMAAVFASYMAPNVLGAPLSGRLSPAGAQRVGMVVFTLAAFGLLVSLFSGNFIGFIAAGVVAGASQGIVMSGSMRGLLYRVAPADRASVLAAIYLVCYLGAAVPNLISGQLTRVFSVPQVMSGYVALAVLALVLTLVGAREPSGDRTPPATDDPVLEDAASTRTR